MSEFQYLQLEIISLFINLIEKKEWKAITIFSLHLPI